MDKLTTSVWPVKVFVDFTTGICWYVKFLDGCPSKGKMAAYGR